MDKQQLIDILDQLEITNSEGFIPPEGRELPYACFWDFNWSFENASGSAYQDIIRYQISFFSNRSRDPKLISLIKELRKHLTISSVDHQLIEPTFSIVHSYFSIDLLETVIPFDDE